jgi:hypothetical protein
MRQDTGWVCCQILGLITLVTVPFHDRAAAAPTSCELLTQQDVSAALHEEIRSPQSMRTGGCVWRGSGTDSVTVETPGTGRPGFENAKSRTSPGISLNTMGDTAFMFVSPAGFVEVGFLKGNTFLTVVVQTRDGKTAELAAKSLAAKIASQF